MSAINVKDLFGSAADAGSLSAATQGALSGLDLTGSINDALGTPIEVLTGSETLVLTLTIDDSGSIEDAGNTQAVIDGVNLILDSVQESKAAGDCLVCIMMLNRGLAVPFTPIESVARLTKTSYRPSGGTPLFDRSLESHGVTLAKVEECRINGVPARGVSAIISDGANNSGRTKASQVKALSEDLLRSEAHLIFGMGIDDGITNFSEVYKSMGVRENCILTPKNTPSEIRKAFQVISRSSAIASQGAAGFSQVFANGVSGQAPAQP